MTQAKSKRKTTSAPKSSKTPLRHGATRTAARRAAQSKQGATSAVNQRSRLRAPPTGRVDSKQARVIAMLRGSGGATIDAIVKATGWQPHSVRGFLAGVVRKKLGLTLVSASEPRGRIYRIADRGAPRAAAADARPSV